MTLNLEPKKKNFDRSAKGLENFCGDWGCCQLECRATAIFIIHIFDWPIWISVALIIMGMVELFLLVFILPSLKWKRWRYEVREEEIELQRGIFIQTRTLIPMIRVQHVDTVQGPLLRKYRLASVIINTAATAHEIPALEESEAEELRTFISNLARVADEDV